MLKFVKSPVLRASCTSCVIMTCGDIACQAVQQRNSATRNPGIDVRRAGMFGFVGLTLHGPFFLKGFQWIDRVCGPKTTIQNAFTKTLLGQATVFPVYVAAFFTYTGLLEGKRLPQAVEKVQNKFWPTYCAGSIFWPCANMVNFTLVPATQRVLYVAGVGLLWNVYLSWQNSRQPASTS